MEKVSSYFQLTAEENAEKDFSESLKNQTVFISVAIVGLIVCAAAVYELSHLWATQRLPQTLHLGIAGLLIVFGGIVLTAILSRGRLLKHIAWTVFFAGGLYLFVIINAALFIQHDPAIAIQHAVWLLPIQVSLFATLSRPVAVTLSSIIFGCYAVSLAGYFFYWDKNPVVAEDTAALVQILVAQAAGLVSLGGLAVYREFAVIRGARVVALKETAGMLALAADEAHAAKERAVSALAKAESATQTRDAFLATMSHELRTPLNAIIGFSQMLEMGVVTPTPTDKQKDYLVDIRQSGEHMLSLINRLLEFSRLKSEECEVAFGNHSLAEICNLALRMVDVLAAQKSICLVNDWPEHDPFRADMDDSAVLQILVNLLSNAVKFTPEKGKVTLRLLRDGDEAIIIEVQDTGIGIPLDMVQRVCEPFVQVGDPRKAEAGGTGLGLAIVTKLAEMHGGAFNLESVLGQGTLARIRLPSTQPALQCLDQSETEIPAGMNV